jgi:hypothetical protein
MRLKILSLLLYVSPALLAQDKSQFQQILDRLDTLERENHELAGEVHALREEIAGLRAKPPGEAASVEERTAVVESRVEEQAQTKVEASHRLPISITGMALFNAFLNTGSSTPADYALAYGPNSAGATWRQSIIGLKFSGPEILWGGKVNGSLYMDFFSGSADSLNHLLRIRTANISLDWKTRSLSFGQDKPLIAPRDPTSLAEVGISPLTAAGNLWLWEPQVRFEQRVALGDQAGLKAQFAVYQTDETAAYVPAEYQPTLEPSRPALQGRFPVWRRWGDQRRVEIALGFHTSSTHVAGAEVPSRLLSIDWALNPWSKIELTGTYYRGRNVGNLGAVGQGFTVFDENRVIPVRGSGGWMQLAILPTSRLSFHIFGGAHEDNSRDLNYNGISRNESYAANAMYLLGSNVMVSLEGGVLRTHLLPYGERTRNYYDLAVAYLF